MLFDSGERTPVFQNHRGDAVDWSLPLEKSCDASSALMQAIEAMVIRDLCTAKVTDKQVIVRIPASRMDVFTREFGKKIARLTNNVDPDGFIEHLRKVTKGLQQ